MLRRSSYSSLGKRQRDDDNNDDGSQRNSGVLMAPGPSSISSTPTPRAFSGNGRKNHSDLSISPELDDMSEDDEADEEYNQLKEPLPELPAYHPRLPALKQEVQNLLENLVVQLKPYCQISNDIMNMAVKAGEALKYSEPAKPLIMLLGATGTGKSSTVNSFVEDLTASKAVASGESVTCVPMVITCASSDRYTAVIRFMSRCTCEEFLQQQLVNYARWEFEHDASWSDEEGREYRALRDTALKVLQAPFCNHLQFSSPGVIREYLQAHRDSAIETLMKWYDELFSGYDQANNQPTLTFDAADSHELNSYIDPHIYQKSVFEEPALWPLVEHVKKGIPGSRVLKHVELLDAPGTADEDRVRAAIALKFTQKCDALWIVSSIRRMVSDAVVDQNLATYGERFTNKISVIAIGSDANVNDALAKELQGKNQSVGEYWQLGKEIVEKQRQLKSMKKRSRISNGAQSSSRESVEDELNALRNEQFEVLVEARNSHVAKCFKDSKHGHFPDLAGLSVFCISNTHYASHKGEPSEDNRLMSVNATNIPALRAHALRLAAPAEFRAADNHITRAVTLVKGAAYWVGKTGHHQHDVLMKLVKAPGELLHAQIDSHIASASQVFDSAVVEPLISERDTFVDASLRFRDKICQWHSSSVRAFFIKDGKHGTNAQPYQVWNERFTEKQTNDVLSPCWERAMAAYRVSLHALVEKIANQLQQLPEALSSMKESATVPVMKLQNLLQGYTIRIRTAEQTRISQMEKTFSNIKLHASRDVADAYYTKAMKPMYDEGKVYRGQGVKVRQLQILLEYLLKTGRNSPITSVPNGIQKYAHNTVTATARGLELDIKAILNEMTLQFDAIFKSNMELPDELAAQRALRPFLLSALTEAEAIEAELSRIRGLEVGRWVSGEMG